MPSAKKFCFSGSIVSDRTSVRGRKNESVAFDTERVPSTNSTSSTDRVFPSGDPSIRAANFHTLSPTFAHTACTADPLVDDVHDPPSTGDAGSDEPEAE